MQISAINHIDGKSIGAETWNWKRNLELEVLQTFWIKCAKVFMLYYELVNLLKIHWHACWFLSTIVTFAPMRFHWIFRYNFWKFSCWKFKFENSESELYNPIGNFGFIVIVHYHFLQGLTYRQMAFRDIIHKNGHILCQVPNGYG